MEPTHAHSLKRLQKKGLSKQQQKQKQLQHQQSSSSETKKTRASYTTPFSSASQLSTAIFEICVGLIERFFLLIEGPLRKLSKKRAHRNIKNIYPARGRGEHCDRCRCIRASLISRTSVSAGFPRPGTPAFESNSTPLTFATGWIDYRFTSSYRLDLLLETLFVRCISDDKHLERKELTLWSVRFYLGKSEQLLGDKRKDLSCALRVLWSYFLFQYV